MIIGRSEWTLDPGFTALTGSCAATVGTCTVINPSTVSWTAALQRCQTGSVVFAARIAAGTPVGTTLCRMLSLSFDGGMPIILPICATTNSADECDLGAPLLDTSGRALLIALLALADTRLTGRRMARPNRLIRSPRRPTRYAAHGAD